jgi:hypothetical protein
MFTIENKESEEEKRHKMLHQRKSLNKKKRSLTMEDKT